MDPLSSLIRAIRSDYDRNGRDWTRPGFRALAVYRFGAWRRTATARWIRVPLYFIYRSMYRYVRNHYGIELQETASVGARLWIAHQNGIVIHPHATIGSDCMIRHNVTIGRASDEPHTIGPTLGDRVNVGVGAVIIGPITVGDDVKIGPNAVVMRDVPSGSFVSGPPAKAMTMPTGTESG